MRRQFDAACRQYEVKEVGSKNLYKPVDGFVPKDSWTKVQVSYDPLTEEYLLNGTVAEPGNLTLAQLVPAWTVGERYTVTVFVTGGTANLNEPSGITFGFSIFSADLTQYLRGSINLASFPEKYTFTATAFAPSGGENPQMLLQLWNVGCTFEDFRFKIQIEKGSTSTNYASPQPSGSAKWPDGLKSGFPSVKMLGKAEQAPNPTPDAPQEVRANNATVQSCGKNLFDISKIRFRNSTPGYTMVYVELGVDYFDMIPDPEFLVDHVFQQQMPQTVNTLREIAPSLVAGRTYTLNAETTTLNTRFRYMRIVTSGGVVEWNFGSSKVITEDMLDARLSFMAASPQHDGPVAVRISNIQIEEGEAATDYEPYFDGGEVTAPMLYGIGEYRDEWDPQTGRGIRRIAKAVLNGSESYAIQDNLVNTLRYSVNPEGIINTPSQNNVFVLCSHLTVEANTLDQEHCMGRNNSFHFFIDKNRLQGTTIAAWMKAQYDAGTPVTIWYVLDEHVPFQTDPQRLTCPTGYGQIIQMAGDIPNAPLEVKYLAHGGNVK